MEMLDSPLRGMRIAVTRDSFLAKEVDQAILAVGAIAMHYPMIEIRAKIEDEVWQAIGESAYDLLLFTSQHGVRAYQSLRDQRRDKHVAMTEEHCAVVGKKTAEVARSIGLHVDVIAKEAHASDLCKELQQKEYASLRKLWLRGNLADPLDFASLFEEQGFRDVIVYETLETAEGERFLRDVSDGQIDAVFLMSGSALLPMLQAAKRLGIDLHQVGSKPYYVSIGQKTTAFMKEHHVLADVTAHEPSVQGMLDELSRYLLEKRSL